MKRQQLIEEALKLLDAGTLPTTLPAALMRRYKTLTPEQAQSIAQSALTQRARGRARDRQQRKQDKDGKE